MKVHLMAVVVALALAVAFLAGRATSPEPANASQLDAKISDVVFQLKQVVQETKRVRGAVDDVRAAIGPGTGDISGNVQDRLAELKGAVRALCQATATDRVSSCQAIG